MICKCCDNETRGTETCSHEHGMAWRYLKKFNLTKDEIKAILSIDINLSIKYKHSVWLKGIQSCAVCGKQLSKKKLLSNATTCSPECRALLKKTIITCTVCGTPECKEQYCISVKRELRKVREDVDNYIIELNEEFPGIPGDLLLKNKLHKNNLKDVPKCPFCGGPSKNFLGCCSKDCGNVFKYSKISHEKIMDHYFEMGIPRDFLESIDKVELGKIFNNKKRKIGKCWCGKWFIDSCCSRRVHFNNLDALNEDGLRNFVVGGFFEIKESMDFFNCSYATMQRMKREYNIQEPTRNTVEDTVIDELNIREICRQNDRTVIYPKEVDILLENFGIEYDGLFWHSSDNKRKVDKNSHLRKTELLEEQGLQLFHIFSNEWIRKPEIWKSVINSKLGRVRRIFGRKCQIREISSQEARNFLESNHLQGSCGCSVRVGLFYQGELVSLMTFGKSRYAKGVEWELIRFASLLNTQVIGGASKLLKYFERNYSPESIISYANRRWSQGNLYEKLGFEFQGNTPPNYFYFRGDDSSELKSREQFQKHKLQERLETFDPDLTETENMFRNGYRKIYDSGNKKYIKKLSN